MADHALQMTVRAQSWYLVQRNRTVERHRGAERGSSTAQTAMILLLVGAAIAAGTIIAGKMTENANNVPTP